MNGSRATSPSPSISSSRHSTSGTSTVDGARAPPRSVLPTSARPHTSATSNTEGSETYGHISKPSAHDPWKVCFDFANTRIKDEITAWKEEIANLLIFASLFSAVVAAFSIESYHSIKQDPSEKTVLLLQTLVALQLNAINPDPTLTVDINPQIPITNADKRINTYNFLSLILSLSVVLGGILSLQWLREYGRNPYEFPGTIRDQLGISFMRRKGMENWHVFSILSALPLVLLLALLLFFAGIIELLLEVDPVAAFLAAALVGIAFMFILMTTLLPTIYTLLPVLSPRFRVSSCPYRSPQAWIIYCIKEAIASIFMRWFGGKRSKSVKGHDGIMASRSWTDYDWFVYSNAKDSIGDGVHWLGEMCVQSSEIASAFHECIQDPATHSSLQHTMQLRDADRLEVFWRELMSEPHDELEKHTYDLTVFHSLESLITRPSEVLAGQRIDLFVRLMERHASIYIDFPKIPKWTFWDLSSGKRRQIISTILQLLENPDQPIASGCNKTHLFALGRLARVHWPDLSFIYPDSPDIYSRIKSAARRWSGASNLDEGSRVAACKLLSKMGFIDRMLIGTPLPV